MATESPILGQLRQIPSPIISPSPTVEPRPHLLTGAEPLQGLVQEMALSAVIQKHGSSGPSGAGSSHSNANGTIIKNYVVPAQANSSSIMTSTSTEQLMAVAASAPSLPQAGAGVVLSGAGGGMQQSFIALPGSQASAGVSLLAHPNHSHTSPVIQGTALTAVPQLAGQLHEVSSGAAGAGNMVQLTPVCYEGAANAQPSPAAVERSALLQPNL